MASEATRFRQGDAVTVSKLLLGTMAALLSLDITQALAAAPAQLPDPSVVAPAAAKAGKLFPILEFRVEGNTVLVPIEVERVVTPFLGIGKSIKDVESARQALEKTYHAHGYQTVLVNIPQQEVSTGVVRLLVVEAPVGRFEIKGSRYHSLQVIRSTVTQLQPGVTPNFNEVQKQLQQLNHTQDLHATPVLRASTTPGQVDVDLDVEDHLPLHAMLEVNNRYSANTAHIRLIGEVSYDNLFQSNQSVSIQYQTAPDAPANAKIWSVSYVIPTASGPVLALYAVRSDSNIAAVGDLNIIGNGSIYGLRVIEPLPAADTGFYHSISGGFDFKDFKQDVALQGADDLPSPARYEPFSIDYTANWLGRLDTAQHAAAAVTGSRSNTSFNFGVSFILRFIGGTDASQFAVKRFGADPSFAILRLGLQRQQILPFNCSVAARVDGQVASGPLISNEQYGAGGVDTVRGYTESERLGDNGIHESVELRTPQLLNRFSPHVTESYAYFFGDAAHLRIQDPLPAQISGFRLGSVGAGLRAKYFGFTGEMDAAHVLTAGYVTRKNSNSVQFRVNYAW